MTIELTDLSEGTLHATAEIWHDGWHEAHAGIVPDTLTRLRTLEDFERRLKSLTSRTRVTIADDKVVGFTIVIKDELYQMYVAQSAQGSGVAQGLMHDALEHMRQHGVQTAWLACSIGNERAAAFYKKTGWRNVGDETVAVDTSNGPFDLTVWRFERML